MSDKVIRLIESAVAGTLPSDLLRGMIYDGKMPNDFPLREGGNPYTDGMKQAQKDKAAGKDLRVELEKLRKDKDLDYSFLGGYEKVIKQQKGVRIDWPANPGYLYKTSSGYTFERDKGHATSYRGSSAREQMRNALCNDFNIPGKTVDAAIKKVDSGKVESLREDVYESIDFISKARSFLCEGESVKEGFGDDESVASELQSYIDNDGNLYRQMTQSILRNMATKKAKGAYNSALAIKAFMYLVDEGAKRYSKDFGGNWSESFPKNIRTMVAKSMTEKFEAEYDLGNYNHMLPKKYQVKSESTDGFLAQARSFLEKYDKKEKKSVREAGGGMVTGPRDGRGNGPQDGRGGKCPGKKKETDESILETVVELQEGEAAFILDTPEHMTQLEELITNLSAAQVPFELEESEETDEIIISWPEGFTPAIENAMEALGITMYDDNDDTPEAGYDYLPYQTEAATMSGLPHSNLPSLFKPIGDEPVKKQEKKKKKSTLTALSNMVQRIHGSGNVPPSPLGATIPATRMESVSALIDLHMQGHGTSDLIDVIVEDEPSKKELIARFHGKMAKPFDGDDDEKEKKDN